MNKSSKSPGSSRPRGGSSMNRPSGGTRTRAGGSINRPGRSSSSVRTPRRSTGGMNPTRDQSPIFHDNMNQPGGQVIGSRPRRKFGLPLIIGLVVVFCCLVVLCIVSIYLLITQGIISF